MTPSYILRDTWQFQDYCSFGHFLGLSLSNLLDSEGEKETQTSSSALPYDQDLIQFLQQNQIGADPSVRSMQCRADWNLTEDNIQNELDRNDQSHVSFYFALRWLQYEIGRMKNKRNHHSDSLLSHISTPQQSDEFPKLQSPQQLLTLCYFQYLESNKFIGFEEGQDRTYQSYLYGHALENSSSDFDEAILILLEMLRVFFPAEQPIAEAASHTQFSQIYSKGPDPEAVTEHEILSITLLSRVFSLLNVDLGADVVLQVQGEHLDFDLALFNTYAATFKRSMRFVFQSIMYRSLREGRYDIPTIEFQQAIESLAFKKMDTYEVGLLMKSILMCQQPLEETDIGAKFSLTIEQIDSCLEQCLALWKKVYFITSILRQQESIGEALAQ